jgi:YkoY family integral membrane protein
VFARILYQHGSIVVEGHDLATIGLLVILEAILSADNAIVLALLAYSLPKDRQKLALRIGIWCAFIFRILAVLFLLQLLKHKASQIPVLFLGGAYLLWLPIKHFRERHRALPTEDGSPSVAPATAILGLSVFMSTVLRIEFTDIVFSVDSILVAMAMSTKSWVIITGGILGIIAMRLVAGRFLKIIERYPAVVDGAYIIVGIAGVKLLLGCIHALGWVHYNENYVRWGSTALIILIFVGSLMIRRNGKAT